MLARIVYRCPFLEVLQATVNDPAIIRNLPRLNACDGVTNDETLEAITETCLSLQSLTSTYNQLSSALVNRLWTRCMYIRELKLVSTKLTDEAFKDVTEVYSASPSRWV